MTWAHYLLQVNIYLVIFYAFYRLLLAKETYFMLNRLYLLSAGVLSLVIPFIRPEWFASQPAARQVQIRVEDLNAMIAQVIVAPDPDQFNWAKFALSVYIIGAAFFTLLFLFRLIGVRHLLSTQQKGMAFSFLNKKRIDNELPELSTIHRHEEIHIRQLHTIDVLFFELLGIVNWCNPIIYLYKHTIKNIHEYLADDAAAYFQGDKEQYAMLLLSKAFSVDQNILTNSFFNKSLIKKRIYMLHKQRSRKTAILKYGLFLPLFAVTLLLSSATIRKNEELKAVAEEISRPAQEILAVNDLKPFYSYLQGTIKYPATALEKQLQGNSIVQFTVSKGEVNDISVFSKLGMGCDAEVMKTILAYKGFAQIDDGKYSLKVAFRAEGMKTPVQNADEAYPEGYAVLNQVTVNASAGSKVSITADAQDNKGKVYDFVSTTKQPSFPGGMDKFYKYIAASVKYPEEALKNNVQGRVYLSYVVETSGKLTEIKVERGIGSGLDEEAVRILENSPKWDPGYDGNTPVRVKYNIPIGFTLDKAPQVNIKIENKNGTLKPLYIIDGVRATESDVKNIKPDDIESISVLKDASATSTYGEDGKNGVILITSKKAKKAESKEITIKPEQHN